MEDKPYRNQGSITLDKISAPSSNEYARISIQNERQIIASWTFHHEEENTLPAKPLWGFILHCSNPFTAYNRKLTSLMGCRVRKSSAAGPRYLAQVTQQTLLYCRCEWWETMLCGIHGKSDGIKIQVLRIL